MNKNKKIWVAVFVVVITAVIGWRIYQGKQGTVDTVKIGVLAPLSGNFAVLGERIRNGMDLAKDDILRAGTVKAIDITYEDVCLPKDAVSAVQKFIQFD